MINSIVKNTLKQKIGESMEFKIVGNKVILNAKTLELWL